MKEVTKKDLWDFVKDRVVTYSLYESYPYTGIWKNSSGKIIAKDVPIGEHLGISTDKYKHYIENE